MIARTNLEKQISDYEGIIPHVIKRFDTFGLEIKEEFEGEPDQREEVERILKLEPKDRSTNNIDCLKKFFSGGAQNGKFSFFQEQAKLYEEKTMQYLYRELRYVEME